MLAISNTSPLLNLAIIGELHLVRQQLGRVLIPPAVLDELQLEADRLGTAPLRDALAVAPPHLTRRHPFAKISSNRFSKGSRADFF